MHPCQISPKMLDLWRSLPSKWSNLSSNCLLLLSLYFLLHLLHLYSSSNSSPLTCILSNTPVLSILLATFTEFPQMSYWGLLAPITPAMTGPWFIPAKTEINVRNTKHTFNFLQYWVSIHVQHTHLSWVWSCWRSVCWLTPVCPWEWWRSPPWSARDCRTSRLSAGGARDHIKLTWSVCGQVNKKHEWKHWAHLCLVLHRRVREPRGRHVRAADGLNLLHRAELGLGEDLWDGTRTLETRTQCSSCWQNINTSSSSYLIEVWYDLVEEAQTLQAVVVGAALAVKLFKLRHRGEHHAHAVTWLAVQVLEHSL